MADNTRERILAVAWELFAEHGYNDVTVDKIIKASNTSKGSFYHFFASKDELLTEWFDQFDAYYSDWDKEHADEVGHLQKLVDFCDYVFTLMERELNVTMVTAFYSAQLNFRDSVKARGQQRRFYQVLDDIIMAGQDAGEISRDFSYKDITRMLMTQFRGVMYEWCLYHGFFSLAEYGRRIMRLLILSFKA